MPSNICISGSLIQGQQYLMRSNNQDHDPNEYIAEYQSANPLTGDMYFNLVNNRQIGALVWNPFFYTDYRLQNYYTIYDLDDFTIHRKPTGFTKFLKDKGL